MQGRARGQGDRGGRTLPTQSLCGPADGVRALFRPLPRAVVPPSVALDLIYQFTSLLPGESTQYHFFDPRYRLLTEIAQSRGVISAPDGTPPRSSAVLAIIFDAEYLLAGDVTVGRSGDRWLRSSRKIPWTWKASGRIPLRAPSGTGSRSYRWGKTRSRTIRRFRPPTSCAGGFSGSLGWLPTWRWWYGSPGRPLSFWARSRSGLSAKYWRRKTWGRGSGGSTGPFRPSR
mmetsp:Transcript_33594/g.66390  ORF Transcript_33594/g.66390 Transcript_33594/m.66390 type:complete len:230 (-) Transcript_33594:665-1354(-)